MPELSNIVHMMNREMVDGGTPPEPCEIGALDFEIDCQLIQQVAIGYG